MTRSSLRSWFVLRAIPGVGDAILLRLVDRFGSPEAVLGSSHDALEAAGCRPQLSAAIRRGLDRASRRLIDEELARLRKLGVTVITVCDEAYPAQLRAVADPPPLLYVQGALAPDDRHAVAIVGARRVTAGGRIFAEELARELAAAGITVVSGLARGVDAAAHRGALAAAGRTIAVMGCGLDRTYPAEHRALRRDIERQGAVLSELPLGSQPLSHNFPRRNRIISGLALGVVVTEAALDSGSLITARLAAEYGREVFAVPGSVSSVNSRGPHKLIREGARLVESARDILEELWPQFDETFRGRLAAHADSVEKSDHRFGKEESLVYDALSNDHRTVDEVIRATGLHASTVSAALLSLEVKRAIAQLPGQEYARLPRLSAPEIEPDATSHLL
jgi:DNA processing protein